MAALLPLLGASTGAMAGLSTIATIAAPVLGVMSAISGISEAKQQSAEFKRQATEERLMSNINAEKMRRESRQQQSRDRTAMIEGGVMSGTSLGVLDQNAVAQELDALTVQFTGEQRATGSEFQAQQARGATGPLDVFSAAVTGFSSMDGLNIGGVV